MKWKLIKKEKVFTHPYVTVQKWHMRLPNGAKRPFLMGGSAYNFIKIFIVTKDKKIVVLKQFYISEQKKIYALVAGIIDKGEKPIATARREALEETGYRAERIVPLGASNKGKYSPGSIYYYLALNAVKAQEPQLEPAEDIDAELMSLLQFKRLLERYKFPDPFAEVCAWRAIEYLAATDQYGL